jgi:hypothetical protein
MDRRCDSDSGLFEELTLCHAARSPPSIRCRRIQFARTSPRRARKGYQTSGIRRNRTLFRVLTWFDAAEFEGQGDRGGFCVERRGVL